MSPENMINALLSNEDVSVNGRDLYTAFRNGFPIKNLARLLSSKSERAIRMGAYVADELDHQAAPCLKELDALLGYHDPQVRSDVAHALRSCVTLADVDTMARILLLLNDPDAFVRRAAMFFILMKQGFGLQVATIKAAEFAPGIGFEEIAQVLPRSGRVGRKTLRKLIASNLPVVRRFAVGLACMPRLVVDAQSLSIAEDCRDAEGWFMVESIRKYPKPMGTVVANLINPAATIDSSSPQAAFSRKNDRKH